MARLIEHLQNTDAPSSDYPYGRVRDNTGGGNGTPANEKGLGDMHQFFAKLMDEAGITANGLPDNDYSGFQLFEALVNVIAIRLGLRSVNTSGGLTGGGNLSADRTLSIDNLGVTTARINDLAVTTGKIATNAVTGGKVGNDVYKASGSNTPENGKAFVAIIDGNGLDLPSGGPYLQISCPVTDPTNSDRTTSQIAIKLTGTGIGDIYRRFYLESSGMDGWSLINDASA